jgi:hypothetical protein
MRLYLTRSNGPAGLLQNFSITTFSEAFTLFPRGLELPVGKTTFSVGFAAALAANSGGFSPSVAMASRSGFVPRCLPSHVAGRTHKKYGINQHFAVRTRQISLDNSYEHQATG